jgi:transposase
MDKYIGFDVDSKKTVACVIEKGQKDVYETLPTDPKVMRRWLRQQRQGGKHRLHLTFEVCGMAGWLYDELRGEVNELVVSNPSKMTWIFRTAKKTDRIDARKMAILLMIGEIPRVHMPSRAGRQWRGQIQHRRKLVNSRTQVKNRIRAYLKGLGYRWLPVQVNWWAQASIAWMRTFFETDFILQDMLDQLDLLEQQVQRVTQRLDERLGHHPGGALLMTIPGVGPRAPTGAGERRDHLAAGDAPVGRC